MEVFGTSYCDSTYEMTRACAYQTVIEYVISGTGTVESPHGIFHPKAGDSYLLRANEPHHYYSDDKDPWIKIWVNFQGKLIDPILDAYGLNSSTLLPGLNTYDYIKRIHNIASQIKQLDRNAFRIQVHANGQILHRYKVQISGVSSCHFPRERKLTQHGLGAQVRGNIGNCCPAQPCGLLDTSACGLAVQANIVQHKQRIGITHLFVFCGQRYHILFNKILL
jgi:hypothetical protein